MSRQKTAFEKLSSDKAKETGRQTNTSHPLQYAFNDTSGKFGVRTDTRPMGQIGSRNTLRGLQRLGVLLAIGEAGWLVGDQLGQWYIGQEGLIAKRIGERLSGQVRAWSKEGYIIGSHLGFPGFGKQGHIDFANGMLSLKSGEPLDFRKMDPNKLADLIEAPWPNAATLQQHSDQLKTQKTGKDPKAKNKTNTAADAKPVPATKTDVDQCEEPGGPSKAQRLRALANDRLSPVGSAVHPHVPPLDPKGSQVRGVLEVSAEACGKAEQVQIPLKPGEGMPGQWIMDNLPGGPGSGRTRAWTHVEGHTAAIMRMEKISTAQLYINKAPCGPTGAAKCRVVLHKLLPLGASLLVHFPDEHTGNTRIWEFKGGVPGYRVIH
jgi:hypothetical protein